VTHVWRGEVAHLVLQAGSSSPDGCGGATAVGVSAEVGMQTDLQIFPCRLLRSTQKSPFLLFNWDILKI